MELFITRIETIFKSVYKIATIQLESEKTIGRIV